MNFLKQRRIEIALTIFSFAVLCAFSGPMVLHQSGAPHFIYQAYAWLHGRLDVGTPPNLNDWVQHDGKWYVSFPSFPAVLMLPFVLINGLQFNDVFFTVCIAALNAGLFFAVLRTWRDAEEVVRSDLQLALLTIFFIFGSVYFFSAIRGEVWYSAHVIGVTLTLIYLWASLDAKHPIIAGFVLGCLAVTRANMAFAFPFFLLQVFRPRQGDKAVDFKSAAITIVKFGVPGAIVFGLAMLQNHLRWPDEPGGGWTQFGHAMLYANRVNKDVAEFGIFNFHYLARNFDTAFLLLPQVTSGACSGTRDGLTFLGSCFAFNEGHGLSIFVTTPLLMMVPFALQRTRTMFALCVTVAIIASPALLYMNDGWYQFGYRFSIDYLPYLFLVMALGRVPIAGFAAILGFAGILVNIWGALAFSRTW